MNIIRHEGRTWETTPATYKKLEEEELRNIIIAHLNTRYEGDAAGEVFRKSGKTDIRIEDKERVAFVAECKIWKGAEELRKALNQLLGYLTWRDCKAALVIFNKSVAGFSTLLEKIPEGLENHDLFVKKEPLNKDGEWKYVFKSDEDSNRLIKIHVFAFNIYVPSIGVKRV